MKQKSNPFPRHAFAALAVLFCAGTAHAVTVSFTLSPVADTRIFNADWGVNNNDGGGPDIGIYQSRDRSLLRFALPAVPVGATIDSANLTLTATGLYGGNPNGESMNIHRLSRAWTETGATWFSYDGTNFWTTAGGDYDGTVQASSTANPDAVGQPVTWDITSLANAWASGTADNHGLVIINSGTTNGLHFAAKENGNGAYRPFMTMSLTIPGSAPAGFWSWSGGNGSWTAADKWLDGGNPATWTNGKDAVFGTGSDTAGTVTIATTVMPRTLWFQNAGSGNYTLSGGVIDFGGAARIIDTTAAATIESTLANGALFKQGAGTLILAGANSYAGGTTILNGVLQVGNGGTAGTLGSGAVVNNASLVFDRDDDLAVADVISGSGSLTKLGSGTLELAVANSYTGTTTVSEGTLALRNGYGAVSQFNIAPGAVLELNVPGGESNLPTATFSGAGTLRKTGAGGLIWGASTANFNFDSDSLIDVRAGTFTGGSHANENWTSSLADLNVAAGAIFKTVESNVRVNRITGSGIIGTGYAGAGYAQLTIGVNDGNSTFAGEIQNTDGNPAWAGNVTKAGSGTITLTGDNTYTGTTRITGGILQLGDGTANGSLASPSIVNNASLFLNTANATSQTLAGNISGTGTLTKTGGGTATLTGGASHAGGTTVNAGILSLGSAGLVNFAPVAIATNAKIDLNFTGYDEVGSLSLGGVDAGAGIFSAASHPLYFTGSGQLVVIAPNDGVWAAAANGDWGTLANWQSNTVASGTGKTATFNGATGTIVALDGDRTIGNLTFSGLDYAVTGSSRTLSLDSSTSSTISVAADRVATLSSKLASTGVVIKTGAGTLKLYAGAGDNNAGIYNHNLGGIDIQAGMVELNSQYIKLGPINIASGAILFSSVPWATGASNPWFDGRSAGPITVQAGGTLTTNSIANSIVEGLTLRGGSVTGTSGPSGDWGHFVIASTVIADGNATSTISAELAVTGAQTFDVAAESSLVVSGLVHNRYGATAGAIIKAGEGTMSLTAANGYSGNTTVEAGTLILGNGTASSSLADGADVTVKSGTKLRLDFSGTDLIDELWLGEVAMSPGTYNAANSSGFITGTGALVVQTGPPPADPFADWIATNWPDLADKTPGGDPDNDGIPNLVEYVLNDGDPSASNPGILPSLKVVGSDFVFTVYRRNASTADTTQVFQYSADLGATGWTEVPVVNGAPVAITADTPDPGIDRVIITIPKASNTELFGRLKVTK